ncbi:pentatricopeptide repeat-containing protein [Tanacetum coccineum]|uniref:Pentatricopeptide repeat-containing protein n=1 Tax=Tanacetum coccineum TaxID=301880 RepID=A0ABQ4WKD9_9ASTR
MFGEAIRLLRRMIRNGMRSNQVTVLCSLYAFGHMGMLQLGKSTHGYILRNRIGPNSCISNGLIDMYVKYGSLIEARHVFDETPIRNLTSWNSMINSFALHGQSESAIMIFEEMIQHDMKPDNVTFVWLLNACAHGGLVDKGPTFFTSMVNDYNIEPDIHHIGCFIDLLGRAGQFDEAMEVIKAMKTTPDEAVWGSLLNDCKIHGRMDLAEFAVKKLIEIDPSNGGECGERSGVHWWRRVKKVVVGRRRYGGVMVVEEVEWKMKNRMNLYLSRDGLRESVGGWVRLYVANGGGAFWDDDGGVAREVGGL